MIVRLAALAGLALALLAPAAVADTQLLLVHGYGGAAQGKDCNGSTGATPCATTSRRAAARARRWRRSATTRATAAAATRWPATGGRRTSARSRTSPGTSPSTSTGVTLGTPHQGVAAPARTRRGRCGPGSAFLDRLHAPGSGLGDAWAAGVDWSLVGSRADATVSYRSAIDKGRAADQKYGYGDEAGHTRLRTLGGVRAASRSTSGTRRAAHPAHHTEAGWSPLKTAFRAATRTGDGLPR